MQEQEKQRVWAASHPKVVTISERVPLSDAAKLVRAVITNGVAGLAGTLLALYLGLAGVTDSMTAARVVLILTGVLVFVGVLVSELVWGKSLKGKILWTSMAGIVLILSLWGVDAWTVRYRSAHQNIQGSTPAPVSTIISVRGTNNEVVNSTIANSTVNQSPNGAAAAFILDGNHNTMSDMLFDNIHVNPTPEEAAEYRRQLQEQAAAQKAAQIKAKKHSKKRSHKPSKPKTP